MPEGGDLTNAARSAAQAQFVALRTQAVQLRGALVATSSGRGSPGGQVLVNVGIRELVPWGWQGTGRKIVSAWERSAKIAAREDGQRRVDALVSEARGLAAAHSIADASLRPSANSAKLLRRFGTSLDRGAPISRLRALIGALDAVAFLDLVPNREVPRLLEQRRFERTRERTIRTATELTDLLQRLQGPQDATYYEARLSSLRNLPGITEPIEGAIARLREGGPDSYRQGAASVRVAFEALINELASERDWKAGILRLVQSDEERGIARRLHRLLSRSAHPGHTTSKEDLQLVLDLFATVATRLVQLRASLRTSDSA